MSGARQAAVAGRFYPADSGQLRAQVDGFLAEADAAEVPVPRAIIAPHAGYPFSGPIAGTAFATVAGAEVERVVVIGPSHYVRFQGISLPQAGAYRTPLGDMPLQGAAVEQLSALPYVLRHDEPHRQEHSIEVELPFLQQLFGGAAIVPLVTGAATPQQVAEALDLLWDDDTLLVVSSDLSHFLDYDAARALDTATADIIVDGDPDDLDDNAACGRLAIQGTKIVAAARGYDIELLDLRNSGDTAGPREGVVGYGAFRIDAPQGASS